jgi:hypothetical protein
MERTQDNEDNAAVIIQSHFRGYTIRKRFGYELEERYKRILNEYDDKKEAHQALLREGLKNDDAALIIKRWYKTEEHIRKKLPIKDSIHPKLRQADLIHFSQTVSIIISKINSYITKYFIYMNINIH